MVNVKYLNTSSIKSSFSVVGDSVSIKQNVITNNAVVFLKIDQSKQSYKKTKSHNEIAKILRGSAIQKRPVIFKRPSFIKSPTGEYVRIVSVFM